MMPSLKSFWVLIIGVLLIVLAGPMRLNAHGGGIPLVTNEPLGAFVASVWLNPNPLAVGPVHVTVALAQNESVVLNQQVQVQLQSDAGVRLESFATHENAANRFLYEADFDVSESGEYDLIVSVAGQDDQLSYGVVVQTASWTRSPWVGAAALGIVVLLWLLNRGGRRQ